jgi:hypothetical protein
MTVPGTDERVTIPEITALLAWARALTEAGPHADPDDRAAYLTAKARLLARITATTRPETS